MATSFNSVRKYRNGLDSIFGGMIDLLKVFTALFMIRQSQRKNSLSFFKQAATENVFIVNRPNFFGCHKNLFFFPRLSLSCFSGRQAAEGSPLRARTPFLLRKIMKTILHALFCSYFFSFLGKETNFGKKYILPFFLKLQSN